MLPNPAIIFYKNLMNFLDISLSISEECLWD